MTAQEALKRNEKSQWLKVWKVDDTWFYVESEDGKIAYKCCIIRIRGISATAGISQPGARMIPISNASICWRS